MTDKPVLLYHGSSAGIPGGRLTPRSQTGDINGEFPDGPRKLVFATNDHDQAMLYTLKNDHMRQVMDGAHPIGIFTNYKKWKHEIDGSACALYALPSETFKNTISKYTNSPSKEWLSSVDVQAASVTRCTPEDVMRTGAQLYFLDPHIDKWLWEQFQARQGNVTVPKEFTGAHIMRELRDAGLIAHHLNTETGIRPDELPASANVEGIKKNVEWLKSQVALRKDLRIAVSDAVYAGVHAREGGHTTNIRKPQGKPTQVR